MTRGVKPAITTNSREVVKIGNPPSWLGREAKREWRRIAPILDARNVITEGDLTTVESYCMAVQTMREGHRTLSRDGLLFGGKKHPVINTMHQAQLIALRTAGELGLTPVSRSRPAIRDNNNDDDDNPLDL
ncbi:MAG: phage terminase small subunit P27 family [Rhizobiales bacterium]|nr:phage terminase small subunit P27 family [Hyphomicrobiales bacterium]